jgi:Cu+-exporting ATPase
MGAGIEHDHSSADARRTELKVDGMTCNNCARHVSEALLSVPGVQSAAANLERASATVRWKPSAIPKLEPLIAALDEAGYQGSEPADHESESPGRNRWSPTSGWLFNVVFGSAVTFPLMLLEWGFGVGMQRWYQWFSFALVLPLQILGGARFYKGAWTQARVGQSNMDTLVALGSTTAFVFSAWVLAAGWHQHVYFMDAAAILTLVSVGHYLEGKASARASASLRALLRLAPETARKLSPTGGEEIVPVTQLRIGDAVVLRPGDLVPSDGEVAEGSSSVNEAMLTGESLPVDKGPGAQLYAGTINESGRLVCRITATGESTALAKIIEIVEQAQQSRASIQRLGDKVSSIFVPIVIVIAIATALWWGLAPDSASRVHASLSRFFWAGQFVGGPLASAIYHAAAVLIIACPCAMGLATPIAIMAGSNAAARRGILIRDGAALEKSGIITAVLFDKTGTLTEGKVSVAAVDELSENARQRAAQLAGFSNHPLSKAIAAFSKSANDGKEHFSGVTEIRGAGIEAREADGVYRLGSLRWLQESGARGEGTKEFAEKWSASGASLVGFSREGEWLGMFALKDKVKADAKEVIELVRRSGKQIYLVTGDHQRTAEAIAALVGIPLENVHAEVRPEGKVNVIKELQARGERIAFVGDGINDAPALQQADLGVALMNASDVARESADIVLLKADLAAIPEALGLARATLKTIKQNLFWAFFYNALGIPLAAFGFISPVFSALAMGLSDLVVIGNALRLRRWTLR